MMPEVKVAVYESAPLTVRTRASIEDGCFAWMVHHPLLVFVVTEEKEDA